MARHFASLPLSVFFAISVIQGFSADALDFFEEPDDTTATLGDRNVELRCSVADKSAKIAWFKGNAKTQITEDFTHLTILTGALRITKVEKDDAGRYYCQASNSNERKTSRTATLTVHYLCDGFQIKADPDLVFHDEDVDLICDCSGIPSPSYTWTKDGTLLGDSGKILQISKAQINDNGSYQCTANNSVKSKPSDQYNLNIIDGAPPKIVNPPRKEVAFVLKQTVMLDCGATGNPTPVVKWYYKSNSKALRNNSVMQIFSNGSLHFKEINRRNAGIYKCIASNKYDLSKSFESDLVVALIGNISPLSEQIVRLGSSFSVKCELPKAKPVIPNVEWTLGNGAPLPSGGRFSFTGNELQIQNTIKSDSGIYQCIARNIAGERRLNVTVIVAIFPEVVENPQNQTIIEGENAILECKFSGDPKPEIVWEKNEVTLSTDQDYYKINGSQLIIEKARPEFSGLYSCMASMGNIKKQSKKAQVTVKEKIRIIKSDRYKFDVGITARLKCKVTGEKPWTITWSKVGSTTKLLPPRITKEGELLIIKKSTLDDSGNYSCKVTNSFSSSSIVMVLNIFKRPVVTIHPHNVTAKLNGSALFHCNMTGYPTPSIVWYKNIPNPNIKWDPLKNSSRMKLFPNGSLHIKYIRKSDDGGYTCIGGNAGGLTEVSTYLHVKITKRNDDDSSDDMAKTVGIAVGCAGAYIILVVGLMIYCKGRRARQAKNKLVVNGEDVPLNVADANNVEVIKTADTKLQFPRHDLEALRTLGSGSYGNVFLAKASEIVEGEGTSIVVVQSLTSKDEEVKKEFMKTMEKLSLRHKNIAKLLGVCQEEDPMYLISEYPEQGDLKTVMRDTSSPLTPTQKVNICAEVAAGMNYLTNHGHVHKDLAARNCLVNKSFNVKISFLSLNQGTYPKEYYKRNKELIPLRWMAPEALKGDFDEVSDVWSFGILVWEVYTEGILPYEERSDEEVHKSVPYDLRLTKPESCPGKIFKMMEQCWEEESEDRPTFGQLCEDFSEIPRENDF